MNKTNSKNINSHRGQFKSIVVDRVKGGVTVYCGKIKKYTDSTLTFQSINEDNRVRTIPLKNVVSVS